jgi:hypothetical protein
MAPRSQDSILTITPDTYPLLYDTCDDSLLHALAIVVTRHFN